MRKHTPKQYREDVFNLVGNEYKVLEDYKDNLTKILMMHCICRNEWRTSPSNFKKGSRCPKCNGGIQITNEEFIKRIKNIVNDEYLPLEPYTRNNVKILMRHNCNKCNNYEWKVTPTKFLDCGTRCPKCAGNPRKNTDIFKKEVYNLVGDEYSVIGDYINTNTHILFKHNECEHQYMVTPSNFLRGKRCPKCKSSKAEKIIQTYLHEYGYKFKKEYTFKNLKDKNCLRFDFAIIDKDNIVFLIEYDGLQHYIGWEGSNNILEIQYHDKLKNEYCKNNNINLLRIPYWDFNNINTILSENLPVI